MVTTRVLKEVWLDNEVDFFKEFSPTGHYSFLFSGYLFRGERSDLFSKLLPSSLREDRNTINRLYGFAGLVGMDDSHPQHLFESFYQTAEINILKNFYVTSNYNGFNLPDVPLFRKYSLDPILFPDILEGEIGPAWLPDTLLEVAALAQHYGLPTRTIDWSRDIYTSLYFASSGALYHHDDSKYMVLYALNYYTLEFLKKTVYSIPLRLIIPEHYKNPNLNNQRGVLSAWKYKAVFTRDIINENNQAGIPLENVLFPLVSRNSLDTLIQEYVDVNGIHWGGVDVEEQEPLIYKFYIPISKCTSIYDYLLKIGYGADRIFSGFEGVKKLLEDNNAYSSKRNI